MGLRGVVAAAAFAAGFLGMANPVSAAVLVTIDKTTQRMTVSVDGERRYTWPVSTGRGGYGTPSGNFKPFRLEKDHYSKEWDDAPMPNSIFFTQRGHAIHGSYETRRLGSPASHGCVRLSPANAATLFALVKNQGLGNTKIVLTGEAPRMLAKPRPPADQPLDLQQQRQPATAQAGYPQPYGMQSQYPAQQHPAFGQPRYQPGPFFLQPQYPPQGYIR
jgi:L,D-transpeptidase-like protein